VQRDYVRRPWHRGTHARTCPERSGAKTEGGGFEPPKRGFPACWFSRPVHSTALPPFRARLRKKASRSASARAVGLRRSSSGRARRRTLDSSSVPSTSTRASTRGSGSLNEAARSVGLCVASCSSLRRVCSRRLRSLLRISSSSSPRRSSAEKPNLPGPRASRAAASCWMARPGRPEPGGVLCAGLAPLYGYWRPAVAAAARVVFVEEFCGLGLAAGQ
jgi:hypothetical protein